MRWKCVVIYLTFRFLFHNFFLLFSFVSFASVHIDLGDIVGVTLTLNMSSKATNRMWTKWYEKNRKNVEADRGKIKWKRTKQENCRTCKILFNIFLAFFLSFTSGVFIFRFLFKKKKKETKFNNEKTNKFSLLKMLNKWCVNTNSTKMMVTIIVRLINADNIFLVEREGTTSKFFHIKNTFALLFEAFSLRLDFRISVLFLLIHFGSFSVFFVHFSVFSLNFQFEKHFSLCFFIRILLLLLQFSLSFVVCLVFRCVYASAFFPSNGVRKHAAMVTWCRRDCTAAPSPPPAAAHQLEPFKCALLKGHWTSFRFLCLVWYSNGLSYCDRVDTATATNWRESLAFLPISNHQFRIVFILNTTKTWVRVHVRLVYAHVNTVGEVLCFATFSIVIVLHVPVTVLSCVSRVKIFSILARRDCYLSSICFLLNFLFFVHVRTQLTQMHCRCRQWKRTNTDVVRKSGNYFLLKSLTLSRTFSCYIFSKFIVRLIERPSSLVCHDCSHAGTLTDLTDFTYFVDAIKECCQRSVGFVWTSLASLSTIATPHELLSSICRCLKWKGVI